uniref:Xylanase inhibitor C-terminal domain-containing protein n=1 Tax=Brassica oleracea var. oleracea TaxID=109376 RepID=A0A0D3AJT2_BRAOL
MSLCLPSTEGVESYSGDLWIGGGPYYYLPFGKDVSTIFASTPLIGSNSGEYLIDVKSIQIGGKNIPILHGTTKISTLAPYTVLHTSIYKALLAVFAGSAKMVRAPAVKPFGACFRSNGGRGVPVIKLVLRGGARWRIYGSNSLVKVCLGLLTEAISVAKEIVAIHTVFSYNRVRNPSNRTPRSQTFPYESYGSPHHFGASDIPAFSEQPPNPPVAPENPPVASRERRNWTPADDEVLMSGWLNTSKDAVVGVDQNKGTFWKRVGEFYASSPHAKASGDNREHLNYIYFADHGKKITLNHAWCMLSYEQKWLSLNTPKPAGNSKRKETCSQASSNSVGDPEVRPEGIKAAKAKKKNSAPLRSLSECQTVWEMKKEDLLMRKEDLLIKERLTKLAILDTLLAKKDPLTEPEEATKNKLLALI